MSVVAAIVALAFLGAGWWLYALVWGRPCDIDHFFDRVFVETMIHYPQALSQTGLVENGWLDFHSGRLNDAGPAAADWRIDQASRNLRVLQGYDLAAVTPQQRLSAEILAWTLDSDLRGARFRYHNYPVNQLFGEQSTLPDFMVQIHRLVDRRSAERYVERLRAFGPHFDQLIASLKLREAEGILPPRFVVTKVLAEMRGFTAKPSTANLLYVNFAGKLDRIQGLGADDKKALLDAAERAIADQVYPAYARLIDYEAGLEGRARATDGVWALPDGDAYYAWRLREQTTSDKTPEEIHQFGLAEVTRIEAELVPLLDRIGAAPGPVGQRLAALVADPRYLFANNDEGRAAILDAYRHILAEMRARLPDDFDPLPKAELKVEAVPAFKAATAPGAYYQGPSLDGVRPGTFFANVYDTAATQRWAMKSLAYHEGVPGHHLQISIRAETPGLPYFRKTARFTAYTEGWALYAERLGWEMGMEPDPLDDIGRLQAELFRAVRLVVDTGIHYKRWSREQAIAYMRDTTGMEEHDVTAEIERYIVDPGQACAYKMGMAKILELRSLARRELGPKFDIKAFHRAVLQDGALPLGILDERVKAWIAASKS